MIPGSLETHKEHPGHEPCFGRKRCSTKSNIKSPGGDSSQSFLGSSEKERMHDDMGCEVKLAEPGYSRYGPEMTMTGDDGELSICKDKTVWTKVTRGRSARPPEWGGDQHKAACRQRRGPDGKRKLTRTVFEDDNKEDAASGDGKVLEDKAGGHGEEEGGGDNMKEHADNAEGQSESGD